MRPYGVMFDLEMWRVLVGGCGGSYLVLDLGDVVGPTIFII